MSYSIIIVEKRTSMKVSLITTVFNEEKTIKNFLRSVFDQSKMPDEVVVVDGGSTDATASIISNFKSQISNKQINFKFIIKRGNRSVGRNEAIRRSSNGIIACSDAGCVLDKDWLKNIIKPFKKRDIDVVAGYYRGKADNVFQKCLIPYVLVMPDRVNEKDFLPATRSMAFTKSIWEKAGGLNEKYSRNEDFVFAKKLKSIGANIVFERNAIVNWLPLSKIKDIFRMFLRFAIGDSESEIIRGKVLLVFLRYFYALYLIGIAILQKSFIPLYLLIFAAFSYILWSINKNYRYVKNRKAFYILPLLQLVSDLAVLLGTTIGFFLSYKKIKFSKLLRGNVLLIVLLGIYILTMLSVIRSGLPGKGHPFTYQMDEWHQFQAVKNVLMYGSPNIEGSANGTMLSFLISGVLLVPFYLAKVINPLSIKSAMDSLQEQEKLFIILRMITLFFGTLSLIVISKLGKILKLSSFHLLFLFTFTPLWLVLSNFFKYDIALVFWVTLSFLYLIKYSIDKDNKNFLLGSFFSGIAFAVKVSAIPLLPIIILAFFVFTPKYEKKLGILFSGILIFLINSLFLGLPDIIFSGRNMNEYLYENILDSSRIAANYRLDSPLLVFTLFSKLPAIFGHALYFLTIFSIFYFLALMTFDYFKKNKEVFKVRLFIFLSFLSFLLSFIPLGITLSANRALVILPLITIINGIVLKHLINKFIRIYFLKLCFIAFFLVIVTIQIFESYSWVSLKGKPSPQEISSDWIKKSVPRDSSIGIENIPIYQFLPDFILLDYYNKLYNPTFKSAYRYVILDKDSKYLPKYIIVSNVDYEKQYLRESAKNSLIEKVENEGYRRIAYFPLNQSFYAYFDKKFYFPYLGLYAYPDGISIFKNDNF